LEFEDYEEEEEDDEEESEEDDNDEESGSSDEQFHDALESLAINDPESTAVTTVA